jgi:hypothetical protein
MSIFASVYTDEDVAKLVSTLLKAEVSMQLIPQPKGK